MLGVLVTSSLTAHAEPWLLIDDFESPQRFSSWIQEDTKNETQPRVETPQVTQVQLEIIDGVSNHYLLKKPAPEGVIGNRKALTYSRLPTSVPVGSTYTFYTRINVQSFPNNHAFGISNMDGLGIKKNDYNAFEPTLRVTDKIESNGFKNDGALMVKVEQGYANVINPKLNRSAMPLVAGTWYETWYVVNNATKAQGGQRYDVYLKGGEEFPTQTKVFSEATFRMQRELPLTHFMMNCNTGPMSSPYGNGGLKYDDLYMTPGLNLTYPQSNN
ncbi:hypothetical protein [Echinimonas agarilytica]|nr:hypothetical protein [Echinimonas agarilytica]